MAKVTTFSRFFPKYHPRSGEPTYFVEQILNQRGIYYQSNGYFSMLLELNKQKIDEGKLTKQDIIDFQDSLIDDINDVKYHTARKGLRYKQDEYFSPRAWSKNPYKSPQIIFLPLTVLEKVIHIAIYPEGEVIINNRFYCEIGSEKWSLLSKNDGLSSLDMQNWFSKLPFIGQIICWSETINY